MYILAINCGSQTLKYKLYKKHGFKLKKSGGISDIGFSEIDNHYDAIKVVRNELAEFESEIEVIGHRYVNGGDEFIDPEIMDRKKVRRIKKYNRLAPLHNPANLEGIKATLKAMPHAINIAVFDTHFYKNLPHKAKKYALNKEISKKFNFNRRGFHGTSHRYVMNEAARILDKPVSRIKLISLHLGGGASATAIRYGRAIDTSMGFTPAEGLVMMTRAGDLDPGIIIDLMRRGWKADKIDNLINRESGLYGMCGKKGMLEVLQNLNEESVKKAFNIFVYRIKKYIGAYYAALNGCDAIVFTGTVGSGKPKTRVRVMENMDFLKKIPVLAIPTDEEYIIAKDALALYKKLEK